MSVGDPYDSPPEKGPTQVDCRSNGPPPCLERLRNRPMILGRREA